MIRVRLPLETLQAEAARGALTVRGQNVGGAAGYLAQSMAAYGVSALQADAGGDAAPGRPLAFPAGCCNCLDPDTVYPRPDVALRVGTGVSEYTLAVAAPHCARCLEGAGRRRHGCLLPVALSLLFGSILAMGLLVRSLEEEKPAWKRHRAGEAVAAIGAIGLVGYPAWRLTRRPSPGQASWYQAVALERIDRDFWGKPRGATLAFANEQYAARFLAENPGARRA